MAVEAPIDRYYEARHFVSNSSAVEPTADRGESLQRRYTRRGDGRLFGSTRIPLFALRDAENRTARVPRYSVEGSVRKGSRRVRRIARNEAAIVRRRVNKFPRQTRIKRAILLWRGSRYGLKIPRQFHGPFHGQPCLIFHPPCKPDNLCKHLVKDSTVAPRIVKTAPPSRGHAHTYPLDRDPSGRARSACPEGRRPGLPPLEGVKSLNRNRDTIELRLFCTQIRHG